MFTLTINSDLATKMTNTFLSLIVLTVMYFLLVHLIKEFISAYKDKDTHMIIINLITILAIFTGLIGITINLCELWGIIKIVYV